MVAAPRRLERVIAAAILIAASALAVWVILRPTAIKPPPVATQTQKAKQRPPLQMEFVELPAETPPELPPLSTPEPAPVTLAQPAIAMPALPALAMPEPAPISMLKPAPPEPPLPPEPLRPEEREAIEPLRPEEPKPRIVAKSAAIEPLRPTPATVEEPKPRIPESPPRPRAADVKPLVPEPLAPRKVVTPPAPRSEPPKQVAKVPERPSIPRKPPRPGDQPTVAMSSKAVDEGRALLRIFERGSGPSIEIRWPADARQRARLFEAFVHCFGMRVGVVDRGGRLYLDEGKRGAPSELNTDRYSGFVRQPEGDIPDEEQNEVTRVRAYHSNVAYTSVARVFPRRVDAFLIGGLREAVGEGYLRTKAIRAAYRLEGERVIVEAIVADGRQIAGAIDLSAASSGCSR
jgi:hypothetical protein